jgi:hypothetical protein
MTGKTSRFGRSLTRRQFLGTSGAVLAGAAWSRFSHAQADEPGPVRFGIVADCHFADREPAGARHYRDSLDKLAACVAEMNRERVDFLVELGDFKDQDTPPVESRTLEYLERIEGVFRKFEGPRYHVLGNHDMDSISKAQFLARVENAGIPSERSYYSFDLRGIHGVVLDANFTREGANYDKGNFDWTDANVPAEQLEWLKKDLDAARDPVVVFVHQRLDGEGNVFVNNADEVRGVLEGSGKVLGVFQGHDHAGAYNAINGIHNYTLRAVVEGAGLESNSYAIVEVSPDGELDVTGFGRAVSHDLARAATQDA